MSDTYTVVMTGKIADGKNQEEVKAKVADLFKVGGEQLDKIFSGKPVAVRRGVELKQADKICAALLNAGAVAKVKADQPSQSQAANTPEPQQSQAVKNVAEEPAAVARTHGQTDTAAAAVTETAGDLPSDLECPRCGHVQPFTKQCGLCKMDLTLHIQRLRRKEQRRAYRREQMAHATG